MEINQKFVLVDEGSFVRSFDLRQPTLLMTSRLSQAVQLSGAEAEQVISRLGWLASSKLERQAVLAFLPVLN